MRFHLGLGAKAKSFFLSSPAKEKATNEEGPFSEFEFKSKPKVVDSRFGHSDFGSKEEIFFDSNAWLDSDCDDDFFSVNGDFTPSRGSTPKHHFTPMDGRKKLFELLLQEVSSYGERVGDDQNAASKLTNSQPLKYSSEGSPYHSGANSVWSSEGTTPAGGDFKYNRKERIGRGKQHCCFPSLRLSCSFNDRRKPKMSPAQQTESKPQQSFWC